MILHNFLTLVVDRRPRLQSFPGFNSTCTSNSRIIRVATFFEYVNLNDFVSDWEHQWDCETLATWIL